MHRESIEDTICDILRREGPDGHVDGADVIAEYVVALLEGNGDRWVDEYKNRPPPPTVTQQEAQDLLNRYYRGLIDQIGIMGARR